MKQRERKNALTRAISCTCSSQGFKTTHTLFGTVVIALFALQPVLGFVHHSYYKKHATRGVVSYAHIWYGRILMVLGIVNGGVGLQLAGAEDSFVIAYSVVAAVIFVAYAVVKLLAMLRTQRMGREGPNMRREKSSSHHGSPRGGSYS